MNNPLPDIQQLRNNIDFASISQFFHTFQSAFRPWPVTTHDIIYSRVLDANEYVFETEDLERMILEPSERIRLEDLIVRMLRLVTGKRFINTSTWQSHFAKEFDKREFEQENPFYDTTQTDPMEVDQPEDAPVVETPAVEAVIEPKKDLVNYFTLPLETRVHLLHLLCEWQLDEPDKFREHLESEEDAVQWRVDPIGYDKKGSTFWLFDDNRLYKETPKPKVSRKSNARKKKRAPAPSARRSSRRNTRSSDAAVVAEEPEEEPEESEDEGEWMPWKLLCATKYEWEQFPLKYTNSKNIDEQIFYNLLVNDLIPKIIPVMEDREKEIKKQEALMHRKRSSRIMIKELEALERSSSFEPELQPVIENPHHKGGRASNRIEKRVLEKEQKEQELAAKAREERALERERRIMEREYRALAREKRQDNEDPTQLPSFENFMQPATAPLPSPVSDATVPNNKLTIKMVVKGKKGDNKADKGDKPKKKYKKKEKFDADGNPIPKKVKLDADGNPIPKKKRGRKPKNKDLDEENWVFDCICGVSGKNLDDGTPMMACEKCGVWQHIRCLQNSGQVDKHPKNMEDITFVCRKCEHELQVEVDIEDDHQHKKEKVDHGIETMDYQPSVQLPPIQSSWQQSSAVRGIPPPSNHYYTPPATSVLPPIQNTTFYSSIQRFNNNSNNDTPSSIRAEPPTPPPVSQPPQPATPSPSHATIEQSTPQQPATIAQQPIPSAQQTPATLPNSIPSAAAIVSHAVYTAQQPTAEQPTSIVQESIPAASQQSAPTVTQPAPIVVQKTIPSPQQPAAIAEQPLPVTSQQSVQEPSPAAHAIQPQSAIQQRAELKTLSNQPPVVTAPSAQAVQVVAAPTIQPPVIASPTSQPSAAPSLSVETPTLSSQPTAQQNDIMPSPPVQPPTAAADVPQQSSVTQSPTINENSNL